MEIKILQGIEGSKSAEGLTVVIDVLRAFSTACYLYDKGVESVRVVSEIEEALELKDKYPKAILLGERDGRKVEGFALGNSPIEVISSDLEGETIIQTTSAGTKGIIYATNAEEIITGSFVNLDAIVKYIKKQNPEKLSIVAMGYAGLGPTEEDTYCAEYIKAKMENKAFDFEKSVEDIKYKSGSRFFEEANQGFSPKIDFELCMRNSVFDFVLKAEKDDDSFVLKKIEL